MKMEPLNPNAEFDKKPELDITSFPWCLEFQHGRRGSSGRHITPAHLISTDGKLIAVFTKPEDAFNVLWLIQRVQQLEVRVSELNVLVNQLNGYGTTSIPKEEIKKVIDRNNI